MNGIATGIIGSAWSYWDMLRKTPGEKSDAAPGADAMAAVAAIGNPPDEKQRQAGGVYANRYSDGARNLFATQLAAEIQAADESGADRTLFDVAREESESGSSDSGSKIAVRFVTENGVKYIVGTRRDASGEDVEVFRIPERASAKRMPVEMSDDFGEMQLMAVNKLKKAEWGASGEAEGGVEIAETRAQRQKTSISFAQRAYLNAQAAGNIDNARDSAAGVSFAA